MAAVEEEEAATPEAAGLDLSQLPVLEVVIHHQGDHHTPSTAARTTATYLPPSSHQRVVLSSHCGDGRETGQGDEAMVVGGQGGEEVRLRRSEVNEYRRRTGYYGPLRAVAEQVQVEVEGQVQQVVRARLVQVRLVSRSALGRDLQGEDLARAVARIPGLIPPCSPPGQDSSILLNLGDEDSVCLSRQTVEQYRQLARVRGPLAAHTTRTHRLLQGVSCPVTVVRLFPSQSAQQQQPLIGTGRGGLAVHGQGRTETQHLAESNPEVDEGENEVRQEEGDGGLQGCGQQRVLSPTSQAPASPSQPPTPANREEELQPQEVWKLLTQYASEGEGMQGLITQFNNESWMEVKRMSDFIHVDGEVLPDVCLRAVQRDDGGPVLYYLRGLGRLLRTGEVCTAAAAATLFSCLSPDHKLCLGLPPAPYLPHLESSDRVQRYFRQAATHIYTPFESVFSQSCDGMVRVEGDAEPSSFSRGQQAVLGVQALCHPCELLGRRLTCLIAALPPSACPTPALSNKRERDPLTQQWSQPPTTPLTLRQLHLLLTHALPEVLYGPDPPSGTGTLPGDAHHTRGTAPPVTAEGRVKKCVSEEEFMQMIDLRAANPGVGTRTLVRRCNVCQYHAPSMLALASHLRTHLRDGHSQAEAPVVRQVSQEGRQQAAQGQQPVPPTCTFCQVYFTTKDQLFDHMNKHRDHVPFQCPFCSHKLTNMDAYKKHVRLTHKIRSVRELNMSCKTCQLHFYTRDHLLLHRVNQNHENEEPFVCKACGASHPSANEFRGHILEHSEKEREAANITICLQCYKVFFSAFLLAFHIQTKHSHSGKEPRVEREAASQPPVKKKNKGPYLRYLRASDRHECPRCRRRFKTRETLGNHIRFSHGSRGAQAVHQCRLCGRKFNTVRRLNNHARIHAGTRPIFQCEECGQIYGRKVQVLDHIRTDHADKVKRHQQQQQQEAQQESAVSLSTQLDPTQPCFLPSQPCLDPTQASSATFHSSQSSVSSSHCSLNPPQSSFSLQPLLDSPTPTPAAWTPIKSPFKVPTVEQTQQAVYSLLQLTDF